MPAFDACAVVHRSVCARRGVHAFERVLLTVVAANPMGRSLSCLENQANEFQLDPHAANENLSVDSENASDLYNRSRVWEEGAHPR